MESVVNLLNGLGVGIVCTDSAGKVRYWNRVMEEWTGVVPDVIYGHSLGGCFPQLKGISQRGTLRRPHTSSVTFNPPSTKSNHHRLSYQAVVTEFKATARDIFELAPNSIGDRSTSIPSSPTHESTEREHTGHIPSPSGGQSYASIDSSIESAFTHGTLGWHRIWTFIPRQQQLEQAHADFVATVSHELRTPLTSIKGFVDTLLQCHGQLSPEQEQRFLNIVKSQADRLIHMVEDVLLVSRLQSGHLHNSAQQLALPDAFSRVISEFSPEQQARLELNFLAGLPTVWADPDRLDQILHNLLDNALRFSEAKTSVEVEAGLDRKDPNRVSITIRDYGCGISSEKLTLLFQRFSQTESPLTRGDTVGTGLGLYITKSLLESLGGHIDIESEVDVGTTCHLDLPSAPDIHWTPPAPPHHSPEPVPEWANSLL
ncbi:MAG: PAS domain-containing sensor histidine kinase [Cyanobacteria bacterium P01_E01_bin.45]